MRLDVLNEDRQLSELVDYMEEFLFDRVVYHGDHMYHINLLYETKGSIHDVSVSADYQDDDGQIYAAKIIATPSERIEDVIREMKFQAMERFTPDSLDLD